MLRKIYLVVKTENFLLQNWSVIWNCCYLWRRWVAWCWAYIWSRFNLLRGSKQFPKSTGLGNFWRGNNGRERGGGVIWLSYQPALEGEDWLGSLFNRTSVAPFDKAEDKQGWIQASTEWNERKPAGQLMVSKLCLSVCGGCRVGSGGKDGLMILLLKPTLFVSLCS